MPVRADKKRRQMPLPPEREAQRYGPTDYDPKRADKLLRRFSWQDKPEERA